MTDDQSGSQSQKSSLAIPDDIRSKYPDLINLIVGSESMNDEERQYWINILPVMTPDQVENLKEILLNEKKQLEAIDKKYQKKEISQESKNTPPPELIEKKRKERKEHETREAIHDKEEAENILDEISNL